MGGVTRPAVARSRLEHARGALFLVLVHTLPAVALIQGVSAADVWWFAGLYLMLSLSVGIGLHRYFAHHTFKTSRAFQLLMGVAACTTFTDPVAFAGKHRLHHKHSDTERDTHAPHAGWWYCWFWSMVDEGYPDEAIANAAKDLMRFPELRWLHRYFYVPPLIFGGAVGWLGGLGAVAFGYAGALALLLNLTSSVNYLCHRYGSRRFATADESRNNLVVALWSFGEGWHNNHHYYPTSARSGFYWWEIDPLYWVIRLLALVGVIWDVRVIPRRLLEANRAASS